MPRVVPVIGDRVVLDIGTGTVADVYDSIRFVRVELDGSTADQGTVQYIPVDDLRWDDEMQQFRVVA